MTREQQIEELAKLIQTKEISHCDDDMHCEDCYCGCKGMAEMIYKAGYRNTFTSDIASVTQKAYKEGYEKAQSELKTEIERLKAGNDKLDKESTAYGSIIQKQDKEIEDLRLQNIGLQKRNEKWFSDYCKEQKRFEKQCVRTVKQAVKEFAEKVKMLFYYEFDELIPSIMSDKIDELLQEYENGSKT